jgi:hypothetical protein
LRGLLRGAGTAGPELALAVTCLLAFFVPRIEARFGPKIGLILGLEFMGLHAFAFLGRIAIARPVKRSGRILRILAFVGLCIAYSAIVYDWGPNAVASFWMTTLATYAGFFFHDRPEQRMQTLVWRWGVALVLFFGVAMLTGLTAEFLLIDSPRKEFLFGLLFFAALGLFDLVHLYDRLALRFATSPTPDTA